MSLEGYLAAKVFVEGLKATGGKLTRESVIDGLESLSQLDIGIGAKVSYSASEHQASHQVWPTIIKGGKFVPLDWSELKIPGN